MIIQRVYKYPLGPLGDWIGITMPEGAEPLCVQMQNGEPYLWARVQVGSPPCTTRFRVTGTGHDLGAVGRYIGTFQLHGVGSLVFHVFADA